MKEREKTDPTHVEPDDATPSEDPDVPQPPDPQPGHVVEEKGEED